MDVRANELLSNAAARVAEVFNIKAEINDPCAALPHIRTRIRTYAQIINGRY